MQDWIGLLIAFVLGFFMKQLLGTMCHSRLVEGNSSYPKCNWTTKVIEYPERIDASRNEPGVQVRPALWCDEGYTGCTFSEPMASGFLTGCQRDRHKGDE